MSVYINMEMPKEIEPDLVIEFCEDLDGKRYARFYHYRYGGLTDWHEVLEVSEPHGRLIDADKIGLTDFEIILCQKGNPFKNALEMLSEKIEAAPTIIPASEEE